jgi:biopolymer transport protein ExbD
MARTFKRKERLSALSEINVTPLIDLAFALLIIFMITAPLLEQTIRVDLPTESPRPQSDESPPKVQVIALDATGNLFWGDDLTSLESLDGLLAGLAEEPDPPIIRLRADRSLPYQKIIDVVDLIQKHRLSKLHLDTRAE